jgi:predicted RND superfamily exporter protein
MTLLERFVDWQTRRPLQVLALVLLVTVPSIWAATKLELWTGFDALLPENKPSVIESRRVGEKTAGVASLILVIDGKNPDALVKFGDALLPDLRALGPEWVGTAENGIQAQQDFFAKHRALYLPLDRIQKVNALIDARLSYEVYGSFTDEAPEPVTRESIERILNPEGKSTAAPSTGPPYPGGYYMNAERTRLITILRTPVAAGDLVASTALRKKVEGVVAAKNPASFDPSITVGYTGDIVTASEQYGTVKNDMASVGILGILLILFVDWLFFLRLRAVLAMAVAIGVGMAWCFALTWVFIGHLNTASGFLVSIVFGNGINVGILLRARFNEARRDGAPLREAALVAYRGTWRATLTVAVAAAVGYGSLATTSFRGFRDFGLIGGYGMLLCWLATYVVMIPLLALLEPWGRSQDGAVKKGIWHRGIPFGAPFARLAPLAPRFVAVASVALAIGAGWATWRYLKSDPIEYELWRLENDPGPAVERSSASVLGDSVGPICGRTGPDGMAILVDRVDQVQPLTQVLQARWDAAPADKKPFARVYTILDLIPDHQAEKLAVLTEARTRLERLRQLGKISDADWATANEWVPADLAVFGIAELPEQVARPFTERDGTRGRIVYIAPTENESVRDVRYLRRWADSFRFVPLPSGETIVGGGRAVVVADMLEAVIGEGPKATLASILGTAIVVFIAGLGARGPASESSSARVRRGLGTGVLVLVALAMGMSFMGAAFERVGLKINFLNFIAIPITCGIGADYAINVVHRWRAEGPGKLVLAVRETGGAVVLCSLTTTLGYLALLRSINAAVRTFGTAAVIGEVSCLFAALVALPALLGVLDRFGGRREKSGGGEVT